MRFFGLIIEREKGTRVGSLQSAIEDVQVRLAKVEAKVGHKAMVAAEDAVKHRENDEAVAEVLNSDKSGTASPEPSGLAFVSAYHRG